MHVCIVVDTYVCHILFSFYSFTASVVDERWWFSSVRPWKSIKNHNSYFRLVIPDSYATTFITPFFYVFFLFNVFAQLCRFSAWGENGRKTVVSPSRSVSHRVGGGVGNVV